MWLKSIVFPRGFRRRFIVWARQNPARLWSERAGGLLAIFPTEREIFMNVKAFRRTIERFEAHSKKPLGGGRLQTARKAPLWQRRLWQPRAYRRCYSPPSATHCFNGQPGNIANRFKSSKSERWKGGRGGATPSLLLYWRRLTGEKTNQQKKKKKRAATCGDVSWQPVKAKAVGGIKAKVWQRAEENFWYRYLENWCGGQKKKSPLERKLLKRKWKR